MLKTLGQSNNGATQTTQTKKVVEPIENTIWEVLIKI
jgi:hypothetical protein